MARYEIHEGTQDSVTKYLLADTHTLAEATVFPELGFNCTGLRLRPDGGEEKGGARIEVLVSPEKPRDLKAVPFHGGLPILFPFPNRVRAGVYTFQGKTHRMDELLAHGWDRGAGQAIHGLVADRAWRVVDQAAGDESAAIRGELNLGDFPGIMEQYPFPCLIAVTYRLEENRLTMTTEVTNRGQGDMPMGFGIHPWFPTALQPGSDGAGDPSRRAAAEVKVPADAIWELELLMPTGAIQSVDESPEEFDLRAFRPLDGLFFDNVFTRVRRRADGWSEAGMRDRTAGLELYVAADGAFREWVLYAPLDRPVIALEPYTCTTDAVNLQPKGIDAGLIALAAGQRWKGIIEIGLRRATA